MGVFDIFKRRKNEYFSTSRSKAEGIDHNIIQSISIYFRNETRKELDYHFFKAKSSLLLLEEKKAEYSNLEEDFVEQPEEKVDSGIRFRLSPQIRIVDIAELTEPEKSKKIVEYLKDQEQAVFDYLYEYELPKVVRLVIRNNGNIQNAEDIFQDALMIVYEQISKRDFKIKSTICGYLYSVSKNIFYKQLEKNNLNVVLIDEINHDDADAFFMLDENIPDNYELIAKVIESLGESCKKLLEYYYFKNMSWVDIANIMGYSSSGSARNQKFKCIQRIKSMVLVEV